MKLYDITIQPLIYNELYTVNKIICVKRLEPISVFKENYDLEIKSVKNPSKNVWYIDTYYEVFRMTAFSFK